VFEIVQNAKNDESVKKLLKYFLNYDIIALINFENQGGSYNETY